MLYTIQQFLCGCLTLVQCRQILEDITSPAGITMWRTVSPRPDRSGCRAFSQDFESAADMSKAVLNIILSTDDKQISTESLSHVAGALNISVSGDHNLRFKLCEVVC